MYYMSKTNFNSLFSVYQKCDIVEASIFLSLFTFQVVSEIRCRLDFSSTFKPLLSSTLQTVQRNRDKRSNQ